MTFRPGLLTLIRLMVLPAGLALGTGLSAYQAGERWGEWVLGAGIFLTILILPFVWRNDRLPP